MVSDETGGGVVGDVVGAGGGGVVGGESKRPRAPVRLDLVERSLSVRQGPPTRAAGAMAPAALWERADLDCGLCRLAQSCAVQ